MFCPSCGTNNDETAFNCIKCGAALRPAPPPVPGQAVAYGAPPQPGAGVPNHLVPSILVTLCCCPPTGIAAIVYAAKVNGLAASGKIAEARKAAHTAAIWIWVSLALGVVLTIARIGMEGVKLATDPAARESFRKLIDEAREEAPAVPGETNADPDEVEASGDDAGVDTSDAAKGAGGAGE